MVGPRDAAQILPRRLLADGVHALIRHQLPPGNLQAHQVGRHRGTQHQNIFNAGPHLAAIEETLSLRFCRLCARFRPFCVNQLQQHHQHEKRRRNGKIRLIQCHAVHDQEDRRNPAIAEALSQIDADRAKQQRQRKQLADVHEGHVAGDRRECNQYRRRQGDARRRADLHRGDDKAGGKGQQNNGHRSIDGRDTPDGKQAIDVRLQPAAVPLTAADARRARQIVPVGDFVCDHIQMRQHPDNHRDAKAQEMPFFDPLKDLMKTGESNIHT